MKYKEFYTLAKHIDLGYGCKAPIGMKVRVHDWNDTHVQISLAGQLVWIEHNHFMWVTSE